MNVYGELTRAQVENKTSDHAASLTGAIWNRTDQDLLKLSNGTDVKEIYATKQTNDTATGANATLTASSGTIRLTDAGLTSIDMIPAGIKGRQIKLINATGVDITINNNTGGTAADRILTGTKANIVLPDESSILLEYDSTESRWMVISKAPVTAATPVVETKSANYTILTTDANKVLLVDASGGSVALTLPTAVGNTGFQVTVKRIDSTYTNTVTLDGNGAETIDAVANKVLGSLNDVITVVSDGTNFKTVSEERYADIVTKSANYTIIPSDNGKTFRVSASGGSVTITLPAVANVPSGFKVTIARSDSTYANNLTVAQDGTEEINGSTADLSIDTRFDYYTLQSNGSAWEIVAKSVNEVKAVYQGTSGTNVVNSSATIINYNSNVNDTHGAVTTGASWSFACKSAGSYTVIAVLVLTAETSWDSGDDLQLNIYKNAGQHKTQGHEFYSSDRTASNTFAYCFVNAVVDLVKGDTLDIRCVQNKGDDVLALTATELCYVSIIKEN